MAKAARLSMRFIGQDLERAVKRKKRPSRPPRPLEGRRGCGPVNCWQGASKSAPLGFTREHGAAGGSWGASTPLKLLRRPIGARGRRRFQVRIEPDQWLAAPFPVHGPSQAALDFPRFPRLVFAPAGLAPIEPFQGVRRRNLSLVARSTPAW